MAFDPIQEDCLRLILENMRRERVFPLEDAGFIERGMVAYQTDAAQLIHTDRDRSFHLTAKAAEILDYRAAFIPDESEAQRQEDVAIGYLEEAVGLDASNWDARRMLAELDAESGDAFLDFLAENRAAIEEETAQLADRARDPYAREFARDLGQRPYLRWLAATASRALISGRYRQALRAAEEALAHDPADEAGARHTAMLAMAKLEYGMDELKRFRREHARAYLPVSPQMRRHHLAEKALDPWTLLAYTSCAWKSFDAEEATRYLQRLLRVSTSAARALYYQTEFPEGVFGRVNVVPGSEDELILAISEATPLLEEGLGAPECASFAAWIAEHEYVREALGELPNREAAGARRGRIPGGDA